MGCRGEWEAGVADLKALHRLGQAMWIDYIRRSFMTSGQLDQWIKRGVRGMTSNPTIFDKAIAASDDYDASLRRQVGAGMSLPARYEALALEDIRLAADSVRPIYDESEGADGYVSLEVRPALSNDTQGTLTEARRLFAMLARPNVLIKVPATHEGIPAVKQLISEGININITLMFSLAHYRDVSEAYLSGLEARAAAGMELRHVASVASFFVSRVDSVVDQRLERIGERELRGKIAVANSKLTYEVFRRTFSGSRWDRLEDLGAMKQRVLWASTSTKTPAYPDTLYVDNLIGPDTVNTAPLETIEAFLDHGRLEKTIDDGLAEAHRQIGRLAEIGVDLDEITEQPQIDGVKAFAASFDSLLSSIEKKQRALVSPERA